VSISNAMDKIGAPFLNHPDDTRGIASFSFLALSYDNLEGDIMIL
jgi:hypothetical protein